VALTARTGCSQTPEYSNNLHGIPGRPAPLVGEATGRMPQEKLNMTNGAPSGAPHFVVARYAWFCVYNI